MSYENGMAAINLEFTDKIPRVEYSAHQHWPLVSAVTGRNVTHDSSVNEQEAASSEFVKKWDYGMMWNILVNSDFFGNKKADMGHASYADGGVDIRTSVSSYYNDVEDVFNLDFEKEYGIVNKAECVKLFNDNLRSQQQLFTDTVTMTGVYITCMSGLIDLFGWDMLLMAAGYDPVLFGEMAKRYGKWMMPFFEALALSDSKVVMIHDDLVWTGGPFIHPDWYRKYIFPSIKKYIEPIKESGKKVLFTSDGNFTEFIDDIAACNVDGFVMEPLTDMKYIAEKYGKTHSFVGNADTEKLLNGSFEDIENEVKRCIEIGKNCPGFFMAVGNHIPSNTPLENALYYNECYEKYSKR